MFGIFMLYKHNEEEGDFFINILTNESFKNLMKIALEKDDFDIKYKFSQKKNIIIGIGGSGPTVKWPIENWITLIDYLNKNFTTNFRHFIV